MKNKMIELAAWIVGVLVVFQNLIIVDVLSQTNTLTAVVLGCYAVTFVAIVGTFFAKEELKKEKY